MKPYFCSLKKKIVLWENKLFLPSPTSNNSGIRGSGRKETVLLIFLLIYQKNVDFFSSHLHLLPAGSRPQNHIVEILLFSLISFHVLFLIYNWFGTLLVAVHLFKKYISVPTAVLQSKKLKEITRVLLSLLKMRSVDI